MYTSGTFLVHSMIDPQGYRSPDLLILDPDQKMKKNTVMLTKRSGPSIGHDSCRDYSPALVLSPHVC
jgi:hypothetical protein